MIYRCAIHEYSFHCFVCQHVALAFSFPDVSAPAVDDVNSSDVVCRDCLTPGVQRLRLGLVNDVEHYFDYFRQLKEEIGYAAMCTECLYEKLGVDLRRTEKR